MSESRKIVLRDHCHVPDGMSDGWRCAGCGKRVHEAHAESCREVTAQAEYDRRMAALTDEERAWVRRIVTVDCLLNIDCAVLLDSKDGPGMEHVIARLPQVPRESDFIVMRVRGELRRCHVVNVEWADGSDSVRLLVQPLGDPVDDPCPSPEK